MKMMIQKKWIQNISLCVVILGILAILFRERILFESFVTPERFFYALVTIVVLLTVTLFNSIAIRARVEAVAGARTSDLLETQKLFVELYRNSPVPYVMVDEKGRVTYPNHAALRLFGLEEESFAGRNVFEMFSVLDDEDGSQTSFVASRFSQGVFVDGKDILIRRQDGSTRYGLLSIFPYGSFGARKKGLMTIVDITKQKEVEEAKTQFVSIASHQLRTPISSMKWNLELLAAPQHGSFTDAQHAYLIKIMRGLEKMNILIDDFLNVSQLELGTKQATFEQINLGACMNAVCEEFEGRIREKGLVLQRQFDERVQHIETDQKLLHMAVSNLVSNATKYTEEGGTILLRYVANNEHMTISVIDSGIGIPPDDLRKLFGKFYRASNVRSGAVSGTGLGLYIVKLTVEQLGGTVRVQSRVGEGTTFDIVLPRSSSGRVVQ